MKEAYVSFEIAKLLKEKGFNVPTEMVWYEHIPSYNVSHKRETGSKKLDYFYWDENTERNSFYTNDTNDNGMPAYIIGEVYSAPTHQMTCAWLREKHDILIIPRWVYGDGNTAVDYGFNIYKLFPLPFKYYCNEPLWYRNYDEAIEAALKYSLKILI